ncbi:MAG TPA: hypothetical protein VGN92_08670 [Mycobacterium sp.]|nr:hypothetical protein [Mycobacterium sp.]
MDADYHSGDDFVVEFLDYRYGFSRTDFGQRVVAAAVRLELVPQRDLTAGEADDLVELASTGATAHPRSGLGEHLRDQAGPIDQLHDETLCYWLRKLVFRGAWLDHRVKAGLLDVAFDEASGGFAYRMPSDQSPLVELAPVPSWAELRYTDG